MKILFISANRIGDAVLTMGALSWLVSTYPEAKFTIACGPVTKDLFRAVPRLENLIVLQKQKRHGHWVKLWKQCIGTHWDVIVDLRNSIVSRLLFSRKKYITRPDASLESKVVQHGRLLGLQQPPLPHIWIDAATQAKADALIPRDAPFLALGPAANWAPKSWDITNFIEVAKRLLEDGSFFTVIPAKAGIQNITNPTELDPGFRRDNKHTQPVRLMIVAAPHERAQVQPLIDAFPPDQIIDLIGQDLLTVAACLKKASLYIGNDSGLMHIAAAIRIPTLGLFGPSEDRVYGPYGPHGLAVRTPESRDELFARLSSPHDTSPNLMTSLTVEAVMAGVKKLTTNK